MAWFRRSPSWLKVTSTRAQRDRLTNLWDPPMTPDPPPKASHDVTARDVLRQTTENHHSGSSVLDFRGFAVPLVLFTLLVRPVGCGNAPVPVAGNHSWHLNRSKDRPVVVFVHGIFSSSDLCWRASPARDPQPSWPELVCKDKDCTTCIWADTKLA
jgi:hypothetical protein